MKIKIALAVFACSGALLALPPSASAAPLSGLSQTHEAAPADNPFLEKVHRWWRRGWGWGPTAMATATPIIGPTILRIGPTLTATIAYPPPPPPPPPPYYYYRPYWGPYY
jgi:hypothetical protein